MRAEQAVKVFNATLLPDSKAKCPQNLGDKFVAAARKDPTFADPFWYIAQCAYRDGNNRAACSAVAEFERRGASAGRVGTLRRTIGCE